MQNVKEQVRDMLEVLPENVTYDDLHYHLFVREKIEQGFKDHDEGRIVSQEDMEAKFKKWLEE